MADANIILKDGNGTNFSVKARALADGSISMYHASPSEIYLPDNTTVGMVGTTMSKFSDGFSGPTLAAGQTTLDSLASKWRIIRNTGVTVQRTGGALVLVSGTTSGNEFLMLGTTNCSIPQNLIATLSMSARSANQELRIGYLEVDAAGQPVNNDNLPGFFSNFCSVLLTGTNNANVQLETLSGSNPATKAVLATGQTASTNIVEYALEVRPEDVTYQQAIADSVATKVLNGGRLSSMVPAPNVMYAPFIWLRNTGAATSTTTTIQRIVSMDIQELQVEVGGGRGNLAASQAIPVVQVAPGTVQTVTVNALPTGANTIGNVNLANAVVSTGVNGAAAPAKVNNAATTNLTLVKATAGKLWGGSIYNSNTTAVYLRFFNANAVGSVTLGTTAPFAVFPVPPNTILNIAAAIDQYGLNFTTGIVYAITGGPLDLDATALATANTVVGTLFHV